MASLTPGVLSNLLEAAAGHSVSSPLLSSSHRSPLLQVIEIVPCLSDNQWRSERFFVKVSDSLHAAYVAVTAVDDADLIRSDKIQLGQFVYICGGLHVEKGCPVPVIRGLKPVPSRRMFIGNPSDLVSSDLLIPFTQFSASPTTRKTKYHLVETRRLSLDSSRRSCWNQTPPVTSRRDAALLLSSPRLKPKSVLADKNLSKNESPLKQFNSETSTFRKKNVGRPASPISMAISPKDGIKSPISKHLDCETPALRNRNVVKPASPISMAKSPKIGSKSSKAVAPPVTLFKLPSNHRTWFDQRILWSRLSKSIQLLGKEVSSHQQVAVSTAVRALEEASAMESVLLSMQAFAELCDSYKKLSAGQVVRRFLEIYHCTQNRGKAIHLLLTQYRNNGSSGIAADRNAASWVQTAVVTGFPQFNLFKTPGKQDDVADHHYIVIQNSSDKLNPKETTSSRSTASQGVKLSSTKHCFVEDLSSLESRSRLKKSASLVEELVRVLSQWFLKYLENLLNKGSFLVKNKEANGKESLVVHLKVVNCWLNDVISNGSETSEKFEDLRNKIQQFLLGQI